MAVDAAIGTRLTPVQRRRRQRIIECAISLAAEGGYDAVQMRTVAARSGVALGTLYRYFTSKEHLLVSAMAMQVGGLRTRMMEKPPRGEDAAARVMDVIGRATRALQRQPNVTSAMLKSLISAGVELAGPIEPVAEQMTAIVVAAMGPEAGGERDLAVAEVIQHVWLAALLLWVTGRGPASAVERKVGRAVQLLLQP